MDGLHDLIPDEVTIKILNPTAGVTSMAPDNLKKPYWVAIGEGAPYRHSFDTLEDAILYIREQFLYHAQ